MRIPLFIFYSKFLCGHHTNPRLTILRDFAEVCNKFWSLLQSSLSSESIKKGRLNFRVSLWKRNLVCLIYFFLTSKIEVFRPKLMTALVTVQLLNTGSRKVLF